MAYQSFCALIVFLPLPWLSYIWYKSSNFLPWTSARPGHSLGHIKVHSPSASTRRMKRSGIHKA